MPVFSLSSAILVWMPDRNAEIIRESMEAYNRGELDSSLAALDDGVLWELDPLVGGATALVHTGVEGVRRFWSEIEESFDDFRLEPTDFRTDGDVVFCRVWMHGRGRASGARTELVAYCVSELRGGRITRIRYFLD